MTTPLQIPNDMTSDERALLEIVMILMGAILADSVLRGSSPILGETIQLAGDKLALVIGSQPVVPMELMEFSRQQLIDSYKTDGD